MTAIAENGPSFGQPRPIGEYFAGRFRAIREDLGWDCAQMARGLRWPVELLARIESGGSTEPYSLEVVRHQLEILERLAYCREIVYRAEGPHRAADQLFQIRRILGH